MRCKLLILDRDFYNFDVSKCEVVLPDSLPLNLQQPDVDSVIGAVKLSKADSTIYADVEFNANLSEGQLIYYKSLTPNVGVEILESAAAEDGSVVATKIKIVFVFLDIGHVDNRILPLNAQESANA